MREQLTAWQTAMAAAAQRLALPEPAPALVDQSTRKRLRQLGYAD